MAIVTEHLGRLLILFGITLYELATRWSVRDRIPVETRFSAPVQTGPGAHPASCTMGTGSFPGAKSGRGVTLTPSPTSSTVVKKE